MAGAYLDLGDLKRALDLNQRRLAIAREIGDRTGEGQALGDLGITYEKLAEPRRAIECYELHLDIARETETPDR